MRFNILIFTLFSLVFSCDYSDYIQCKADLKVLKDDIAKSQSDDLFDKFVKINPKIKCNINKYKINHEKKHYLANSLTVYLPYSSCKSSEPYSKLGFAQEYQQVEIVGTSYIEYRKYNKLLSYYKYNYIIGIINLYEYDGYHKAYSQIYYLLHKTTFKIIKGPFSEFELRKYLGKEN